MMRATRLEAFILFSTGVFCTLLLANIHSKLPSQLCGPNERQVSESPSVHIAPPKVSEPDPAPASPPKAACAQGTECLVLNLNPGGAGGRGVYTEEQVNAMMRNSLTFNVWDDLLAFTGMSEDELMVRLRRFGRHHFKVEHSFASPQSSSELAMYYRSSTAYVWGNSIHPAIDMSMLNITADDGPVLEYSGGVGSNVLALASRGIKSVYFGIGVMEYEFAHFRVQRHGFGHMVEFIRPYRDSSTNGWLFDPFRSLELGTSIKEPLGGIFALDVFEHIPDYHVTARHLISLLREGGRLYENTPFSRGAAGANDIHLKASMPLEDAFEGMRFVTRIKTTRPKISVWEKESRR